MDIDLDSIPLRGALDLLQARVPLQVQVSYQRKVDKEDSGQQELEADWDINHLSEKKHAAMRHICCGIKSGAIDLLGPCINACQL